MENIHTLNDFLTKTAQKDIAGQKFQLENHRMLEINVTDPVWTKLGSRVAHRGNLKFEREGMFEHGIGKMIKRSLSGETNTLTKVTGTGTVYLADYGKHITLINLQNESMHINGNDLLAFESSIEWDVKIIRRIAGMLAGGLFSVQLSGTGTIALCSHGEPLTLRCTPDNPIYTDPNATIAWSQNLFPEIKVDMTMRTLLGRGSGETIQMQFVGDGFVIVQPYEEGMIVPQSAA